MTLSYREELLENTENAEKLSNGKYRLKCPWCNKKFQSKDFLKAVNREGVHRSKKHIQEEGKIPKPENGRKKKTSIQNNWNKHYSPLRKYCDINSYDWSVIDQVEKVDDYDQNEIIEDLINYGILPSVENRDYKFVERMMAISVANLHKLR